MMAYIFVVAAVLAVIPILFLFKKNLEKLKEDPTQVNKVQINFMIGVAVSEIIPILLMVYGFIELSPVEEVSELYIPGFIILLFMGMAVFFINSQRRVDVEDHARNTVNSFATISIALVNAIPIMALVGIFMMAP
ncbi:F0F1-type ATP synthase membrane subunit c/vacuolar-type H+-ATPase subunit K [Virgibacillus natechei]|uniref:F0F1-type ATP synthase membrane subunit c/vacuolar-type H+-ATPase subunit K n=1 Tax=Virgibacillus natechei TaxID=1216297 RepID=A0ABS4IKN5_9BACI|nr:hypothetical protein [Virgibacillus natechei]MBP1971515.1 F0F1-type ATP synthase membrane subunit c/vacuolar-type H+-ATPase subunit K [Virgibacillus natechei]UZD12558.1 hypothetical protein OLD84_16915 [Virgibacillus natechei]